MELIDGIWYIKITGDYAGVVSGRVFDISDSANPATIDLEVLDCTDFQSVKLSYGLGADINPCLLYKFTEKCCVDTQFTKKKCKEGVFGFMAHISSAVHSAPVFLSQKQLSVKETLQKCIDLCVCL